MIPISLQLIHLNIANPMTSIHWINFNYNTFEMATRINGFIDWNHTANKTIYFFDWKIINQFCYIVLPLSVHSTWLICKQIKISISIWNWIDQQIETRKKGNFFYCIEYFETGVAVVCEVWTWIYTPHTL